MRCKVVFSMILIIFSNVEASEISDKFVTSRNCNKVNSKLKQRYIPYEETYETRNFLGFKKLKTRINYKVENVEVFETEAICCHGYDDYEHEKCRPVCSHCDPNAVCTHPETCACNPGYRLDHESADHNSCAPVCLHECANGYCSAPQTCACNDGYRRVGELDDACVPVCDGCAVLEYCVEPHVCRCIDGYTRPSLERLDHEVNGTECRAVCDRDCKNGDCVEPNLCRCWKGYAHVDRDEFECEPVCRPTCYFGNCTSPGVCTCYKGHRLRENSTHVCEPICTRACVNSTCGAPETCICDDGYEPSEQSRYACVPFCSRGCEHGQCIEPEVCSCDPGYSEANNGTSCEPVCAENCTMGNCTAPDTCTCAEGHRLSSTSKFTCQPVCDSECPTNAYCSAPNECSCREGYYEKNSTPGDDDEGDGGGGGGPRCAIICECKNGRCSDNNSTCESCADGYHLVANEYTVLCQPYCESGCEHGFCAEPGRCECDRYYRPLDDEHGNPAAVCVHACGGECQHGVCDLEGGECDCWHGWTGPRCDRAILCALDVSSAVVDDRYDIYENETRMGEPWAGPICNAKCLHEISNETKCTRDETSENQFSPLFNFTCFLAIDSPCNEKVMESHMYKGEINLTLILVGVGTTLVAVVIAIALLAVFRRQSNMRAYESTNSVLEAQKKDEDCLIVNEDDSISL